MEHLSVLALLVELLWRLSLGISSVAQSLLISIDLNEALNEFFVLSHYRVMQDVLACLIYLGHTRVAEEIVWANHVQEGVCHLEAT